MFIDEIFSYLLFKAAQIKMVHCWSKDGEKEKYKQSYSNVYAWCMACEGLVYVYMEKGGGMKH